MCTDMVILKIWCVLVIFLISGCYGNNSSSSYPSIPGYDLSEPTIVHLRTELDEISGIVYYPKDTSIFAINDEVGVLFKIYLRKRIQVERWKFSDDADYEDIAIVDSTFYVLLSNGNIKAFTFESKESVKVETCKIPVSGKNDFESLYFDQFYQQLVLICKDCEQDKKKSVSAFAFKPSSRTFQKEPFFTLDGKEVAEMMRDKKLDFKPSAAAIHPITKELFIVSSIAKVIAIADRNGEIKKVYPIDPHLFKQPEGITFTPNGDLLISNESAELGAGNILIFKYNP